MDEQTETTSEAKAPFSLTLWWSTIIGICAIIILGSVFVTKSYLNRRHHEIENWRPPYQAKLEKDIELINRDGKQVNLGQLKGKVFIAGYQYTDCPGGCLGMAAIMQTVHKEFSKDPRFHLVSISLNPKDDTPEKMNAWVKDKGVDEPNWWFLTGEQDEIWKYMSTEFLLPVPVENTDPALIATEGKYRHDQRLVLVDEGGNVRGYYAVMNPQFGMREIRRMNREIKMVLDPELRLKDFAEEIEKERKEAEAEIERQQQQDKD